jgi:streptomycin 6-kinase
MDKDKIIAHFGENFYAKVVVDLGKYAELWGLSGFEQVDHYSANCVFKCMSVKYGMCILKISNRPDYAEHEYNALKEYDKGLFCKLYEADVTNGALLIERIMPGAPLRAEENLDKRLDVFCELSSNFHVEPANKSIHSTYMDDWVSKMTGYMSNRKDYEFLYSKMAKAEQICRDLWAKYPDRVLLHGDLHHNNILLGKDGQYRIIDPIGIIGSRIFEISRFIVNEFPVGTDIDDSHYEKFAYVAGVLSAKLSVPEKDIRRLFYIETCMLNCWKVQGGKEPRIYRILFAEKILGEGL